MSLSSRRRAVAHQLASLLLAYPDDEAVARLDLVDRAARALPPDVATPLLRVVAWLRSTPLQDAQEHYVQTLDTKRSCAPYLTYYSHGDTRRRGMALLEFRQAYREAGLHPPEDELPDHLAVVLELCAVDSERGIALLREHRAGLELLRKGLQRVASPYADVLTAVLATLPAPTAADLATAARRAAEGPPIELVGLSPYPTPVSPAADGARR